MANLIIELPTWTVNKKDLLEIADKMQVVALNVEKIFEELKIINEDIHDKLNIEASLSWQYDEFFITATMTNDEEENFEKRNICHIEVVTKEVAISNDKELLKMSGSKYTRQEIESDYEVGGTLSDYKKLGDSIYYYKEM